MREPVDPQVYLDLVDLEDEARAEAADARRDMAADPAHDAADEPLEPPVRELRR